MINKKFKPAVAAVMTGAILAGAAACPMVTFAADSVDLNSMTLDDITAKAKEEGDVESVGMPDSWANWGLTLESTINDRIRNQHMQIPICLLQKNCRCLPDRGRKRNQGYR